MRFCKFIKHTIVFLLAFLLGAQTTYANTELVLPQNQVAFSVTQSQSFKSLKKSVQPNVGFLKEKSKFVGVECVSAVNNCNFPEVNREYLVNGVDDWFSLSSFKNISAKIPGGVNKTNIGKTLWNDAYKMTPPNGSSAKNIIYNIIANGDALARRRFATA